MPSNIEIKARARDWRSQMQLAESLSDTPPQTIDQEDFFFNSPQGRLKLRVLSPDRGELIYYERDDREGPKRSNYSISATDSPESLKQLLQSALGIRGVVKKKRILFLAGQTRIHFDEVESLGYFLELEVVMKSGQSQDDGQKIAIDLTNRLEIKKEDLIQGAYIDLLTAKQD